MPIWLTLAIGLSGYAVTAATLAVALLSGKTEAPALSPEPWSAPTSLPALNPLAAAGVLIGSAIWVIAVTFFTRARGGLRA